MEEKTLELRGKVRPSFGGTGHSLGAGLDSGAVSDPRLARLARFGGFNNTASAGERHANEVGAATAPSGGDSSKLTSITSSINEKLLAADSGVEITPMASHSV